MEYFPRYLKVSPSCEIFANSSLFPGEIEYLRHDKVRQKKKDFDDKMTRDRGSKEIGSIRATINILACSCSETSEENFRRRKLVYRSIGARKISIREIL